MVRGIARAPGDVKPLAIRVVSQIVVFMGSMRPLEGPCSIEAMDVARCLTMEC